MFFAAAPPPSPVSFSREIAPILAMHCNSCHGDAGGLITRSYKELMLGGNLGKLIIPGDPARSLILAFIEGRRGEQQRMPKQGTPLASAQIDTIRRWIAEGAIDDKLPTKTVKITRIAVPVRSDHATRVFCRVNTPAYLTILARDPGSGEVLWSEAVTLKDPKEEMDVAKPGELIFWDLRAGYGWPNFVNLELSIQYAASEPRGTEFYIR
jgi:hypothetical protein